MNILLAVSGSISAYKAFDLTRAFIHRGHNVRVVLTEGALQFVIPQVFRYLGAEAVWGPRDDFAFPASEQKGAVLHVELAKWADRLIIAPLSANTLSRLVRGEAHDLLSSLFLALPQGKPVLAYPAMNTHMLNHPFVQDNLSALSRLRTLPNCFIHPTLFGELACGDIGEGKLPEVDRIVETALAFSAKKTGKRLLISTGATIAPLDPVRYLTNSSSGITGLAFAREALLQGHEVVVVAGKLASPELDLLATLPNFTLERVTTPAQMHEAVARHFKTCDAYFSSAAIGDFEFTPAEGKLKKNNMGDSIPIKKGVDVLAEILASKRPDQKVIGFAAETELTEEVLAEKMNRKPVDLLVGTKVHNGFSGSQTLQGFGTEGAHYALVFPNKKPEFMDLKKSELASTVLARLFSDNQHA
jgi:phosphopantothenoylcysteine decarboxylase/phosphopantothenate--cysteine ligase